MNNIILVNLLICRFTYRQYLLVYYYNYMLNYYFYETKIAIYILKCNIYNFLKINKYNISTTKTFNIDLKLNFKTKV